MNFILLSNLNPGPFNIRIFNHEFLNHWVEKVMVEKFMIEKYGVESTEVEAWGPGLRCPSTVDFTYLHSFW